MRSGRRGAAVSVLGLLLPLVTHAQPAPSFTLEEHQWIQDHPVVYYAADPNLPPIEYIVDDQYRGLASEYLAAVARKSGLHFRMIPTKDWRGSQRAFLDGKADIFPNIIRHRVPQEIDTQLLYSSVYFATPSLIVTRSDSPIVTDLADLNGKVVAVRGVGVYAEFLATHYPDVKVMPIMRPEEALNAVVAGDAFAAIGTDVAFLPIMRRRYTGMLSISGMARELLYTSQIGVRSDRPELYSIVNKSLASLSAQETDWMDQKWLEQTDFGEPSLLSIMKYHWMQLIAVLAGVILLGWFAYRARSAKHRAQKSEQAKSRFLAMMSHEIRTPMNAVLASIEMLERSPLNPRQQRFASTASTAAESLLSLLDDVLDLSKLDAKRLELELIPTNIEALANKAADIARVNAQNKALPVNVTLDNPGNMTALIDPTRYRQVLTNLLGNSVKFTQCGCINLDVRIVASEGDRTAGTVISTITDTGIGIASEHLNAVFEAYSQAESSTTRQFGGTGLGLTICRELVELMGGTLQLRSQLGIGTTVTFQVPVQLLKQTAAPVPTVIEAAARPATSGYLRNGQHAVLVVEDHPGNRFIIVEQLNALGIAATAVSGGTEALEHLEHTTFDLVLMDCHMPGMSGYKTTQRLREREAGPAHLPVIAISAAADSAHLRKCLDAGMDGVLKKPLRLNELRGMLQAWLDYVPADQLSVDEPPLRSHEQLRGIFEAAMDNDLTELRAALSAQAWQLSLDLLHRIRGAAFMVKANAIAAKVDALETVLHTRLFTDTAGIRAGLADLIAETRRWLAASDDHGALD